MHIVDMILSSIILIGFILIWKNHNVRWMFLLLGFIQVIEYVTKPYTIQWTQHYYIWLAFLNVLYLLAILTRGVIADALYSLTKLSFFKTARKNYSLTIPECALCLLIFLSFLLCVSQWIEIQLYYYKVINYPFIYHHLWVPAQYTIHTLESLAFITFIGRTLRSNGAQLYESN